MKYSELNLKTNTNVNTITVNEKEINVLQYLPIQDKIDLVQITLNNALEDGNVLNDIKLEIYFNTYLIFLYTDLEFEPEEKMDINIPALYDQLQSNGVITAVIEAMDTEEYDNLFRFMTTMVDRYCKYYNSAAALLRTLIQDLPGNAAAAAEMVENFDPEKYENVVNFAKSLNGGRDIPQN